MKNSLTSRPEPRHRETIISLISRAATMRGLGVWQFASDLGFAQKSLIALDLDTVDCVAELFELTPASLRTLVSWTPQPLADVRMKLRGEVVVSRAVMNPTIRGCPICLQEDALRFEHTSTDGMVMRGDWHLKYVILCIKHKAPLVTLWTAGRLTERYDFAVRFKAVADALQKNELKVSTQDVTSYDRWIDQRLESGEDSTWLGQHSIDVAANFCLLLGTEILRSGIMSIKRQPTEQPARALGFDVACMGKERIIETFQKLIEAARGPNDEAQRTFGHLYRWLSHTSLNDPRYDLFRSLLREAVLAEWPIPSGTKVLGTPLLTRQRHSISTAATASGVSTKLMRHLLISEKVIDIKDQRPYSRLTFDAVATARLLETISRLANPKEMRRILNCKADQFEALVKSGVLIPRFPLEVTRRPWDPSDAEALLKSLSGILLDSDHLENEIEHIHRASIRSRIGIDIVIAAVRAGSIRTYLKPNLDGYKAIYVQKNVVDATIRPKRPKDPTVAEFAKSVGLHRDGHMTAFVAAGHLSPTILFNPRTGGNREYVTAKSAASFHQQFITLKLLSTQINMEGKAISLLLRKAGIQRFTSNGADFGPVYLLQNVNAFLREHSDRVP